MKDKKYCKVRYHCHYTGKYKSAVHSTCNLKYSVPKKIHIVFHNESNYDYHFIIKESAVEFKKQFTCLGEKTEKYIIFRVPIEKEIMRIDENAGEIKYIYIYIYLTYYIYILSNLLNRIKCKYKLDETKCETCGKY